MVVLVDGKTCGAVSIQNEVKSWFVLVSVVACIILS